MDQSPSQPTVENRLVQEVVDRQLMRAVFQPIVDPETKRVFGYEALARSLSPHFDGPLTLYQAAARSGHVGDLGRIHRIQAVRECPDWPLFLNLYPNEFDYGWLVRPDDPIFRHRHQIYLEITESVPLSRFEQCHSVLWEIRKKGALLAIDDLGAGYSNLKYIADLEPTIVKLDRELITGVREPSRQFRLLRSIVGLCQDMGAKVVAEGVSTPEELTAARRAGVDLVQGYLLARPDNPPPKVDWSCLG